MSDNPNREELQRSLDDAVQDRDVRARGIMLAGVAILLLIMASFSVPVILFTFFTGQDEPVGVTAVATPPLPPEPRLQTDEYGEWDAIFRAQNSLLDGYEYIDEEAGTARIPISRAMDIMVQRGMPVRAGSENFPIDREGFAEPEAAEWNSGHTIQSGR